MPIDRLSGTIEIRTRDQVRDLALKDYQFRVPDADTSPNSQPYIDATLIANVVAPIYSNASRLGDATTWLNATGDLLTTYAEEMGRPRKEAAGSLGYVIIEAASGGGTLLANAELRHQAKGLRFKVVTGGTYLPGDLCAIEGIDAGLSTNLDAGETLKWVTPPPGIHATCKVFENTDGSGLSGGGAEETDEDLIDALKDLHATPPASGNEAAVLDAINRMRGIPIQRGFVFSCIEGPGEYVVAFTMRPDSVGASRLPNGAHIARVEANLLATFPGDDGIMVATVADHNVAPCIKVRWSESVDGFVDATPWPPYVSPKITVRISPAPTANSCQFQNCTTPPAVGNTIAFYDQTSKSFKRKRILTVSTVVALDRYDVTFDNTAAVSDPTYVPIGGAIVSPYASNMDATIEPLLAYMDKQGVGELKASFGDPGRRQRRQPASKPDVWPHTISNSIVDGLYGLVDDATLMEPATPFATTTGVPPFLVYLHRMSDLGIFLK